MISELLAILFSAEFSLPTSAFGVYLLWREQRFYKNLARDIYGHSMYKKGPESDRLFHGKMDSLCTAARDSINRHYKSQNITLKDSRMLKSEIDAMARNLQHGPRGQFWKISYLTRRKLSKLDSRAVTSLGRLISNLNSNNDDTKVSECIKSINDTNEALTNRTLLVTNTRR